MILHPAPEKSSLKLGSMFHDVHVQLVNNTRGCSQQAQQEMHSDHLEECVTGTISKNLGQQAFFIEAMDFSSCVESICPAVSFAHSMKSEIEPGIEKKGKPSKG